MVKTPIFIAIFSLVCFFGQTGIAQNYEKSQKIFSFGVIADVQYADVDQVGKRNYRESLSILEPTIQKFNQYDLSFIASLGDLIDRDYNSFEKPLALMALSKAKIHHILGNHEFSVEDNLKKEIPRLLDNPKGYYSFEENNFLMLVLNGMEESMDAYPKDSKKFLLGQARYQQLKSSGANNAQTYNGGLGAKQTQWLKNKLRRAKKNNKKIILFCHFPLLPENGLQLWENREVLEMLKKNEMVVAYFAGHHHSGNYVVEDGIHLVTFKGMVESKSDISGALVDVYEDKLVIHGLGEQEDQILQFASKNIAR